jgi:predicted lipoprotein with Yx(FWY)xxD motif
MTKGDGYGSRSGDLAIGPSPPATAVHSAVGTWLSGHRWIPVLSALGLLGGITVLLVLSLSGSSTSSAQSVAVANSSLGRILVDSRGLTLYLYAKDGRNASVCTGVCERVWPPATISGTPAAAAGVSAGKLKTIKRSDRRTQLVYNGHPLYTFSEDTRPGQIDGEGFLGVWYVVSPAGRGVKKPGSASQPAGY